MTRNKIIIKTKDNNNCKLIIENIKQVFNNNNSNKWNEEKFKSNNPFDIIRSIALFKN